MKIEITKIDNENPVHLSSRDNVVGYNCEFKSTAVDGRAVVIPYSGNEIAKGSHISVETDQISIKNFKIIDPSTVPHIQMNCDESYSITGIVELVTGDEVFDIEAKGFYFALDNLETNGVVPNINDHVSFTLYGLSLWDEGI